MEARVGGERGARQGNEESVKQEGRQKQLRGTMNRTVDRARRVGGLAAPHPRHQHRAHYRVSVKCPDGMGAMEPEREREQQEHKAGHNKPLQVQQQAVHLSDR